MPIHSRWTEPVPNCSLQKWILGSSFGPLADRKTFIDADDPTKFVTLADYRLLAKQVALGLKSAGLSVGDRVLIFSGNSIYFPVVFLGVLMAGGVVTGANPTFKPRELAYQLKDSGAKFMFAAGYSIDTALEAAREVNMPAKNILVFDTTTPGSKSLMYKPTKGTRHWTGMLAPRAKAEKFDWFEPKDARTATCCLNYSSGTTGVPKGVEITHYSYVANGAGVIRLSETRDDHVEFHARSVILCFLPMYHAFGQTYFIANFARMGVPMYVMPSFDFMKMLSHIQRYRVTSLVAVPPILVALAKKCPPGIDLSSIEQVACGAAPLAAEVVKETEDRLPRKDLTVRQGWGMTEVTCTCLSWDANVTGSSMAVGELMPNCKAKLMRLDGSGEITAPWEKGELWVSGPTLMKGYWNKPEATAQTMVVDKDGTRWLKTGDVAIVETYGPGALFHVVDRIKELIKVKGNQVAPAELEAELLKHDDVEDAGVVGVTIAGMEMPRAYVVLKAGTATSSDDIAKWMEARVAKYKALTGGVKITDAIPKNPSGKILRQVLREQAKKEVGDAGNPKAKI